MEHEKLDIKLVDLEVEAHNLFIKFDLISDAIRKLEKKLQDIKINFPYRYCIESEPESLLFEPEERHKALASRFIRGYTTRIRWFFSWEFDEKSDKFRLFLNKDLEEYVVYHNEPDNPMRVQDEYDFIFNPEFTSTKLQNYLFASSSLMRVPFIETKLELRLKYAKEIAYFIRSFTRKFYEIAQSIESSFDLPNIVKKVVRK